MYNTLVHLSSSAFSKADCGLIRHCFLSSSASFTGFNSRYKFDKYSNDVITCANFVRDIRLLLAFDSVIVTNSIVYSI